VTISKAFGLTFGCAVAFEALRYAFSEDSLLRSALYIAGYLLLVVLGFLLGTHPQPYRTTFAKVWAFVILWFIVGILILRLWSGGLPSEWTADQIGRAQRDYVIVNILFLPLAFASGALGVLLRSLFRRFSKDPTDVA
jgi:hypothetical protein